jgi:NMT1/THI5 like
MGATRRSGEFWVHSLDAFNPVVPDIDNLPGSGQEMPMADRNGGTGFGQVAPSKQRRLLLGAAACLAVLGGQARSTERVRPLRVVGFAGASNWPLWVGKRRGFFAKEKLDVSIVLTPSSRQMASDVFSGKYDIALTSIDSVVSYDEGQGSVELADRFDFVAFMGLTTACFRSWPFPA